MHNTARRKVCYYARAYGGKHLPGLCFTGMYTTLYYCGMYCSLVSFIFLFPTERSALIQEAITAVKTHALQREHARKVKTQATGHEKIGEARYKHVTKEARRQGEAREMLESMVRRAERNLLEAQRKSHAQTQSAEARAEALATELFHRPGSLLTDEEISRMMTESGCNGRFEEEFPACFTPTFALYRKIDGTCNNLENPYLGAANTAMPRLIQAQYEDGISSLRGDIQNMQGGIMNTTAFEPPNPSPRHVSQTVIRDVAEDERLTHMVMQWGQFLDHDMSIAPALQDNCGERAQNCEFTDICHPIRVTDRDPMFGLQSPNHGACIPFSRSVAVCRDPAEPLVNRGIGTREQINILTSFIDGSMIYANDYDFALKLREFEGGLLKEGESFRGKKPELPRIFPSENIREDGQVFVACPPQTAGENGCFLAGDFRVNEQVALTVMHTLFLREHNRIARELARLNPTWGDERLYQEARKIIGAIIQKISYEDYLIEIFGQKVYDIVLGPYIEYDPRIHPGIINAFTTAAYRYGHSLIRPFFQRLDSNYDPIAAGPLSLFDIFFNPDQFRLSFGTDPLVRGLISENSRRNDEFMTSVLTSELFRTHLDLASFNIQRGRDHGLPPYLTWKRYCEAAFPDLPVSDFQNKLTLVRFLGLYGSLDTVDLWVGGLSEERLEGSLLGSTFACLFGIAFSNVRDGDRFFYMNPGVFEPEQVASIQKHSLARIICDDGDDIDEVPMNVFVSDQPRVPCSRVPTIDLSLWQEDSCHYRIDVPPRSFRIPFSAFSRTGTGPVTFVEEIAESDTQNDQFLCINAVCPAQGSDVELLLLYPPQLARFLELVHNNRLPENIARGPAEYRSAFPASLFGGRRTGVYKSLEDCTNDGATAAFTIQFTLSAQQEVDDSILDLLEEKESAMSPNTSKQLPQSALDFFFPSGTSDQSETTTEMEEDEDGVSDAQLMSDLEEALKFLNV